MEKLYQHIILVWAVYHPLDILSWFTPSSSHGNMVPHYACGHTVNHVQERIPSLLSDHSL
jgi:hypothetical protein